MKHPIRFSGALVLSLFINLIWSGSQGITASTGATPEIELLNSTVDEDVSVNQMWLHMLIVRNGVEEEYSIQLDENELAFFLPAPITAELLISGRDLVRDPVEIEAILALVNPAYEPSEQSDVDELYFHFSDVANDTWGCIKCCFAGLTCCCEPKNP